MKKAYETSVVALTSDWLVKIRGTRCLSGQLVSWDNMSRHLEWHAEQTMRLRASTLK